MPSDVAQSPGGRSVCPASAGPAWRAASAAGIDMGLLEQSLQLTPWERLRENDRALGLMLALEEAGKRLRERSAEPA